MPSRTQSHRRNFLKRVLMVQERFEEMKEEGTTKKAVYRKHIKDAYSIGYHSFINYLGLDARGELKRLEVEILAYDATKPPTKRDRVKAIKCQLMKLEQVEAAKVAAILFELFPELGTVDGLDLAPISERLDLAPLDLDQVERPDPVAEKVGTASPGGA